MSVLPYQSFLMRLPRLHLKVQQPLSLAARKSTWQLAGCRYYSSTSQVVMNHQIVSTKSTNILLSPRIPQYIQHYYSHIESTQDGKEKPSDDTDHNDSQHKKQTLDINNLPKNIKRVNRPLPTFDESDLVETFQRGGGPGGQSVNKSNSLVLLKHIPTGIVVKCQEQRSQAQNRKVARKILRQKLDEHYNPGNSVKDIKKAIAKRKHDLQKEKTKLKLERIKAEKAAKKEEELTLLSQKEAKEKEELQRLREMEESLNS